jgi:hypothetical protein
MTAWERLLRSWRAVEKFDPWGLRSGEERLSTDLEQVFSARVVAYQMEDRLRPIEGCSGSENPGNQSQ